MLDTAPHLGLRSIGFFLSMGQSSTTAAFLSDVGSNAFGKFRGEMSVGAISVNMDVLIGDEAQEHIAVVNGGRCHLVIGDDFALSIDLCVVFVPVMEFLVLNDPTGIDILLCQLVLGLQGVSQSIFRGLTILDGLIVLARVPLTGSIHEGGIYDGSFVGDDALCFEHTVKLCKQLFDDIGLGHGISEQPDGLCVGHTVLKTKTEKPHEAHPVIDLIFCLVI